MALSEMVAPSALGAFLLFAAYVNLNDPDWMLWSTAYTLGALVCCWTVASNIRTRATAEGARKQDSSIRRWVALVYGAASLGLAAHSAFFSPDAAYTGDMGDNDGQPVGLIVGFLSSEVAREAGGSLIMAQAMSLCYIIGAPLKASSAGPTAGGVAFSLVSVGVAGAAIALGLFLPGYLQRAGIAVPAHCGGGD